MKHFSSSATILLTILSLFTYTSKIQASGFFDIFAVNYDDSCLIKHFGHFEDKTAFWMNANNTPIEIIIDAFIDCPGEMLDIYSDKLICNGANELVKAVMISERSDKFFSSIKEYLDSRMVTMSNMSVAEVDALKSIIYASFIYDCPLEAFSEFFLKFPLIYYDALFLKATSCETQESKAEMIRNLNYEIEMLNSNSDSDLLDIDSIEYLKNTFNLVIKFLNNEKPDFSDFNNYDIYSFIFTALYFNRFDMAINAVPFISVKGLCPLKIRSFYKNGFMFTVKDGPRAERFLKDLIKDEVGKKLFDELMKEMQLFKDGQH